MVVIASITNIKLFSINYTTGNLTLVTEVTRTVLAGYTGTVAQVRDNQFVITLSKDYVTSTSGSTVNRLASLLAYSYEISATEITYKNGKSVSKSYATTGTSSNSYYIHIGVISSISDKNGSILVQCSQKSGSYLRSFYIAIQVDINGIITLPALIAGYVYAVTNWECDSCFSGRTYDDAGTPRPIVYLIDGLRSSASYCRQFYISATSTLVPITNTLITKTTELQTWLNMYFNTGEWWHQGSVRNKVIERSDGSIFLRITAFKLGIPPTSNYETHVTNAAASFI